MLGREFSPRHISATFHSSPSQEGTKDFIVQSKVCRPRPLLLPCYNNRTLLTRICPVRSSVVICARKQGSFFSAKFLNEHMFMSDKDLFCAQNQWSLVRSFSGRRRTPPTLLNVKRSSSLSGDLKTSTTVCTSSSIYKGEGSYSSDGKNPGEYTVSSLRKGKDSYSSDVKRHGVHKSSSISEGQDSYSSDAKRHGYYTSSSMGKSKGSFSSDETRHSSYTFSVSDGKDLFQSKGDQGRRSSNKGFDVLEELIPSVMASPRGSTLNPNDVWRRGFVNNKRKEKMSQIGMVSHVERHGTVSSVRKGKDPHQFDMLKDVIDDEVLVENDGSKRVYVEDKGRKMSQAIVRDMAKGHTSSMRKNKVPNNANSDQGRKLSNKGFDGLNELIPFTMATSANRNNESKTSPLTEDGDLRSGFVKDKHSGMPQTDVKKRSGFTSFIGKRQGLYSSGGARGNISRNKGFDVLNDNNVGNDHTRNREIWYPSYGSTTEDDEDEDDDDHVEQQSYGNSSSSSSSSNVTKLNTVVTSPQIQSNERASLQIQSNERASLQSQSNERSYPQSRPSEIPPEKAIFGFSKGLKIEKPSLRGQEVLWALQQAAIEKAKLKQKKRKGTVRGTSEGFKSNQVAPSMEIKNWEDSKPIVIKQEWNIQIEDMEKRISNLRSVKTSSKHKISF